jgi:hypothetical protein
MLIGAGRGDAVFFRLEEQTLGASSVILVSS